MRKRVLCAMGALALASLVLWCGCEREAPPPPPPEEEQEPAPLPTPAPAGEPIKIGAIFAITGPAAWLGEPERNTARMIEKQINEAGGIGGQGGGRPIEVIIEDTEGDNATAVRAVKELIRQEVVAIIGPSRSGTSMAVLPVATEAKIPLISCAAAESIVSPIAERKWIFKTPQKDSDCGRRIFEHMQKKGITKIAIISGATGFGALGAQQLKALAPEYGITIVAEETYAANAIDMTAQLTRIRGTEAQALVNWSIVAAQSQIAKDMKRLEMTIPLYQSHGFGNIKYAQAAGQAGAGIIFPAGRLLIADTLAADHPQQAVLVAYKHAYEEAYGGQVSTFGGHAYDALWLAVKAIERGGPTPAAIRDALEAMDFIGTAGHFKLSPTDHCGLDKEAFEVLTVEWKDGKARFVKLVD